jgi:DNA-binding LytR/AlgR family response regulator
MKMPIRTLIVDDESPARHRLRRMLANIEVVEIVGEAESGVQAVEMIERHTPDLVLLDIQMPGLDGFGVIEALEDPPLIIFVTAYDEYAIRAFEVHALDYLLKPFSQQRLERSIHRAREELIEGRDFAARLAPVLEGLADRGQFVTRLAVHDRRGARSRIRVVDVDEVDWFGIESDEVILHVGEDVYAVPRTLTELESRLDPDCFFRAHRSAIVNLDRIQEIIPWFKGSHKLRLTTGAEVDLSRRRARVLREILRW